jgi:hypothetical protein
MCTCLITWLENRQNAFIVEKTVAVISFQIVRPECDAQIEILTGEQKPDSILHVQFFGIAVDVRGLSQ